MLTILSDTPPNWKRMHRNQAKKQSDGLAVLVLKTKSKWWKISYVMGRLTPDSHMEVRCLQEEPREWSHQPLKKKLGTSHAIKGFAIGSFLEHIVVVERANNDLC